MLSCKIVVVIIAIFQLKWVASQNSTEDIVNGYGEVVGSYSSDPNVEKEYPCPTKCSPIHYCLITVYTNKTAEVTCKACLRLCKREYRGAEETNICERFCPAIWELLNNSTVDPESKTDLDTLLEEYADFSFHNVLLPVPDMRNVARTVNGVVMAILAVVVSLLGRKGMSVLEAYMGTIPKDDEEPIIPNEGPVLPTAERLDLEDGATNKATPPTEHVQLQEVGAAVGYGTVEPQTQGAGPSVVEETKQ